MSDKEDKKTAATNRLLDILRAQQTAEEKQETEDKEAAQEKPKMPDEVAAPKDTESAPPEEIKEKEFKEPEAPPVIAPEEKVSAETKIKAVEEEPPAVEAEKPVTEPEPIAEDLLLKTRLKTTEEGVSTGTTAAPEEFNDELITTLRQAKGRNILKRIIQGIIHRFDDASRKITLHADENTLWISQIKWKLGNRIVEKIGSFNLPYDFGGETITEMDNLVSHVLRTEFSKLTKKSSFGSYFSATALSKTQAIETPYLKKKEITDLVEWNSKKNLPFNAEDKTVSWEVTRGYTDPTMRNVVIGVKDRTNIENDLLIFKKNGIKLRFTSTLPVLLWKSFVRNYPDLSDDTVVLVHFGEIRTTIIVIAEHKLLYSREIAIGANDFYKAIMQKIIAGDKNAEVDYSMAKKVLYEYGFPTVRMGLTEKSNVDLYKVSILLRPIVERIISEINRSLNYFKNQNSALEWDSMMFNGVGAAFPNLIEEIQQNIYMKVEVFNPLRYGNYSFHEDVPEIKGKLLPVYSLNFSLSYNEVDKLNILPEDTLKSYKFTFRSKLFGALFAVMVPVFVFTSLIADMTIGQLERRLEQRETRYLELAYQTRDYASMVKDIEILDTYNVLISNDQKASENELRLLKLFSTIVPEDIKLTSLSLRDQNDPVDSLSVPVPYNEYLYLAGLVNTDKSVAEIYLTDFILKIEESPLFLGVILDSKGFGDETTAGNLVFAMKIGLANE
jgi:Tfp pilus assembly PilM family ATPase